MRAKSMVLILIALACGLIASIGISQVMDSGAVREAAPTEKIYVALADIDIGKKLDENNLKLEAWPKDKIPQGAAKKLEEVKDKYPRQRFYPGEPILVAKLTDNPGAAAIKIPEGHRVVSVKVDVQNFNTALLSPGDRVDVLVFLRKNADIPQTVAKTVIRNACVFAVGSETERTIDKDGKAIAAQTVSLVVTPDQGRKVLLAMELGRLQLVMRRPDDPTTETDDDESETSLSDILGKSPDGEKQAAKTPPTATSPKKSETFLEMLRNQGLGGGNAGFKSTPLQSEPVVDEQFTVVVMNPDGQEVYQFQNRGELPTRVLDGAVSTPTRSSHGKRVEPLELIGTSVEINGMAADGRAFDWNSYRGKTVLVMVWSAACPGCRVEMPVVTRMHESYRDLGLEVVGVNLDRDPNVLGQFLADTQIPWTNLHGPAAQELVTRFGIPSTPYFLLIGSDGKLITVGGHVTELAVHIDLVLKAQAAKSSRAVSRHIADEPGEPGAREESAASREAGGGKEE